MEHLADRVTHATARSLERRDAEVERAASVLASLNPTAILGRGYALLVDATTQKPVGSVRQVDTGTTLETVLHDGTVTSTVTATSPASSTRS